MIQMSDVEGRLRLFRYGLIVVTVVAFLVSLLAPWASFRNLGIEGLETPPITQFLGTAVIITVVVAVISVILYFVYAEILKRTVGEQNKEAESAA